MPHFDVGVLPFPIAHAEEECKDEWNWPPSYPKIPRSEQHRSERSEIQGYVDLATRMPGDAAVANQEVDEDGVSIYEPNNVHNPSITISICENAEDPHCF